MRNSEKMLWIDMFFRCFGKFPREGINKKFFGNYYLLKPGKTGIQKNQNFTTKNFSTQNNNGQLNNWKIWQNSELQLSIQSTNLKSG